MSFYSMLFGKNPQATILLAVIGLKENDIERFRDVHVDDHGTVIAVYTRTGGGNRESYPNLTMRKLPSWRGSVDDEYDSTYCTDTFEVPTEFVEDVKNLDDVLTHGLRAEFGQHLAKTLRREPTESDKETKAYEAESAALARTKHFMANGHTFVPMDDYAMRTALEFAEKNGGELRSCWGIMPINLTVKRDYYPYPQAKDENSRRTLVRVEVGYDFRWTIDDEYWKHVKERWADEYPLTIAKISEAVESHKSARASA